MRGKDGVCPVSIVLDAHRHIVGKSNTDMQTVPVSLKQTYLKDWKIQYWVTLYIEGLFMKSLEVNTVTV